MKRVLLTLALAGCAGESMIETGTAPLRPDSPGSRETFRFNPTDVVEHYDSPAGDFRIHYTRTGRHAVPGADVEGPPQSVVDVAARYDDVLRFYRDELGFRSPLSDEAVPDGNGGDGRFDVYLVDFDGVGDGHYSREACLPENTAQCAGYMAQDNDFRGYGYPSFDYAVRVLASHEFFHAIQAAYDADQGTVLSEGTAVWATEKYDPELRDFEGFISGYLDNTSQPWDEGFNGPVDPYSYGSALIFQFLDERYGTEIIPALWAACVDGAEGVDNPRWVLALDALLQRAYDSSMSEAMADMARWNLFTREYADPQLGFERGRFYPEVAMDREVLPFEDRRTRLFRTSINYWRFPLGLRERFTASLVGDDDDVAGLRLFVSGRRDGTQTVPIEIDPRGAEVVELDPEGVAIVHVVNTNLEGSSKRPGLCAGSPDEVATCLENLGVAPPEPEPDLGVPEPDMGAAPVDAAVAMDAGPAVDGGSSDDEGGCSATPTPGPWLALVGLLGLARRRRTT